MASSAVATSTHSCSEWSLIQSIMPSVSLCPSNLMGSEDLSFGYQRIVGQPEIQTPSTQLRVPSKLAKTMLGLFFRAFAAAQKWGAIVLQCPHHGAQIFTKNSFSSPKTTSLQVDPTKVLTSPSSFSGTGADFKKFLTSPASTFAVKTEILSAVTAYTSARYFLLSPLRTTKTGVFQTLTPRYSENLLK